MDLIFNELSIAEPGPNIYTARERMAALRATMEEAVSYGVEAVLHVHYDFWNEALSEDYYLWRWDADAEVDLELRRAVRGFINRGRFLEDLRIEEAAGKTLAEVHFASAPGHGLMLAVLRDHGVVSVSSADEWKSDKIDVDAHHRGEQASKVVPLKIVNFHEPEAVVRHAAWIARWCCAKPVYENPGHHDPKSHLFRNDGKTSRLPDDAEQVFHSAFPEDRHGLTWWGQNRDGYWYRYQGYRHVDRSVVHWNGSTDPANAPALREGDVPAAFRGRARD